MKKIKICLPADVTQKRRTSTTRYGNLLEKKQQVKGSFINDVTHLRGEGVVGNCSRSVSMATIIVVVVGV